MIFLAYMCILSIYIITCSKFQVCETMEELVDEISELLVPAEKYDEEDAVVEVLKALADLFCTPVI